jgi:hypothetical protein
MTPRDEKDALLNLVLPFSVQSIEQYGEIHPHGALVQEDGDLAGRMAEVGDEFPPGEALIEALNAGFRTEAAQGRIRATAIAANVTIEQGGNAADAIRVIIEHRDDDPVAIAVFMPYGRADENSQWEFGELQAEVAEPQVFN